MKLDRSLLALCVALTGLAGGAAADVAPKGVVPTNTNVLFWSEPEREGGFRAMEKVFPTHYVGRGWRARPQPKGTPVTIPGVEAFMEKENAAGVMVVQDGQVRYEGYARGYSAAGRWTSFSVAKSFTSTLVGAAIVDHRIKSIDERIDKYLPELKGSGYDGVTIRQVLTMTSGVKWNEDYADPNSDVARFALEPASPGHDPTIAYMRRLPREAAPGSKWVYKTGETNLIGVLVSRATHRTLAEYLQQKVWIPYGMEQPAAWITDASGQDQGGFGLSVALHDYARMGQFVLEGGHGVVPPWWFPMAGSKQTDIGQPGFGYGFQWWTRDDGAFDARGIFGQMIHIDPKRKLVVVINSDWDKATGKEHSIAREAFLASINKAVDASPQRARPEPQPVGPQIHG